MCCRVLARFSDLEETLKQNKALVLQLTKAQDQMAPKKAPLQSLGGSEKDQHFRVLHFESERRHAQTALPIRDRTFQDEEVPP